MAGSVRCECGAEFRQKADEPLCPRCQREEDRMYANDPTPVVEGEYQPWRFSRSAMLERLGVTGNFDE